MINYRQIAQAIQRGRRFLKALKAATDSGPVTLEQFHLIAKAHKIDKAIAESYIVSGELIMYELVEPAIETETVILMEPGKYYLAYWKQEPTDEMAYHAVMISGLLARFNAYGRFLKSCNLPAKTFCQHCSSGFASRLGKKFCSDKCRKQNHLQNKAKPKLSIRERSIRFLRNVRNLLASL